MNAVRLQTSGRFYRLGCVVCLLAAVHIAAAADTDIRLNTLGFLKASPKRATIVSHGTEFSIKKAADHSVVYTGTAAGPRHQDDINQEVWIADFSPLQTDGVYYLDVPGVGRSIEFAIGGHVYDEAYVSVMRGFYLWRCGTAVEANHRGVRYAHGPCHLEDGWQDYVGTPDTRRDGTGGWHDAGDYGKYTVNAGITMGVLFLAWEQFGDRLRNISLELPQTAPGYPDYLQELKWETDWLLKMPYPDGSGKVSHKLTRLNFSGFVMPEKDTGKRYFTDWGSAATADFAAVMAMAARGFKPFDAAYADRCLNAAVTSYQCLKNNPQNKAPDQQAFSTGGYGTSDSDDRLWAAAQLWETTGQSQYLNDFELRAGELRRTIDADWDWGNVKNLGLLTYILSSRPGRNPQLLAKLRGDLMTTADAIVRQAQDDVYARPLGRYYWGSNGSVARQAVVLMTAHQIEPKEAYVQTALDAIGHLFGRNYYGRSYVTGLGHRPPLHPHDRRSGADGIEAPWPGYLVGGGQTATNWNDRQDDYRTNEIAINWQAALVYALAAFADDAPH